jgi:hypothetical protein
MNYTPPDQLKQTSCKECIFAIYDDKTQTGCVADRISKFSDYVISAYDDEKEFFVIDRICNLYRTTKWNDGNIDLKKAIDESSVTFDLLINCDNIDSDYSAKIVKELIGLQYPQNKVKVYLFQSSSSTKEEKHEAFQLYQSLKNCLISIYFDKTEYIYGVLQKSKNTFHVILDQKNIDGIGDLIIKINELIVQNLSRFILCQTSNKIFISNMALKLLYQNLYLDYDNVMPTLIESAKKEKLYIEL